MAVGRGMNPTRVTVQAQGFGTCLAPFWLSSGAHGQTDRLRGSSNPKVWAGGNCSASMASPPAKHSQRPVGVNVPLSVAAPGDLWCVPAVRGRQHFTQDCVVCIKY